MNLIKSYLKSHSGGFGIVEIIVAMGIFLIIVSSGATVVIQTFTSNRLSDEETNATLFAQEGIEATRSIKNQNWSNLAAGIFGIDNSGGFWQFSGTSNSNGKFTREIIVENVQRDISGNIVVSGGSIDPDTFKVTSSVNWDFTTGRNNTVDVFTYLTNFRKPIIGIGNWANPQIDSSTSLDGNQNGWKVQVKDNFAYIIRAGGNPDFQIVDITNTSSPVEIISSFINLPGTPEDIAISGNYAFVASQNNSSEFQVINISNPNSPSYLASSSINLVGSADANGISVSGNYAYIVRDEHGSQEFHVIDISNPTSPVVVGSVDLSSGNNNDVVIIGSTAYVASSHNSFELKTVNISNPSSPTVSGGLDVAGNDDATTISGTGNTIILGRTNGEATIINASAISLYGTFNAQDSVNDISIGPGDLVFLATNANNQEFQVINISNPSTPSLLGFYDLGPPNNDLNGIAYHSTKDRVIAVGEQNNNELVIFRPQ